jgi:hypothetical protein
MATETPLIKNTKNTPDWIRPWNVEVFDDLYNRDERFFSILIKGALSFLTRNIILYNKPIKHFIFNTGSGLLYVENNGYEFSWKETTGEDTIYMSRPRCVVTVNDISIKTDELTQPHIRATYERLVDQDGTKIMKGFNAEIRRIPVSINLGLQYVLSNFNEGMILTEELIDQLVFIKYFDIVYLGQKIICGISIPENYKIEVNKVDYSSADQSNKIINLEVELTSSYPKINQRTELYNNKIISSARSQVNFFQDDVSNITDTASNNIQ